MSYIKTLWTNKIAPAINAMNLNKIEQGIFDAANKSDNNLSDITQIKTDLTNIQLKPGPIGAKGDKGDTGQGIRFGNTYDTKADMITANPTPTLGDTHFVKENQGEFWSWADTTPPHDGTHATWESIGNHLQGPVGPAGAGAVYASNNEVDAGTEQTKAISPYSLRYFHDKYINVASNNEVDTATDDAKIITPLKLKYALDKLPNFDIASDAEITAGTNNTKGITPLGLKNVGYIKTNDIATISKLNLGAVGTFLNDGGAPRIGHANYQDGYISFTTDGNINMSPKTGKKVMIKGHGIASGIISGTTLKLFI